MRETGAYRAHDDPLRGHLMDQRGWPEAVNDVVGRPPPGQEVDTGTFVAGRIINILAPRPFRCYWLPECFRDTPMPLLARAAPPETWAALGVIRPAQGTGAAAYRGWQTEAERAGAVYRFGVVASSTLDTRHVKVREVAAYEKVAKTLAGRPFRERRAAAMEVTHLLRPWSASYHQLHGEAPPMATCDRIRLTLVPDQVAQPQARDRCGRFVRIPSLLDRDGYPARHLLDTDKGPCTAAQALRFLKSPAWVGACCLKSPERVAAFGYGGLLAAIVYPLLERQVRCALAAPGHPPLQGLDHRPTQRPTADAVQVILSAILVLQEVVNGHVRFRLTRPLSDNQRRVLPLAGFSEAIDHFVGSAEHLLPSG